MIGAVLITCCYYVLVVYEGLKRTLSSRKREVQLPSPMASITRVTSMKVLDVINSRMSVSEHVSTVMQLLCAIYIRPQDSPSTR